MGGSNLFNIGLGGGFGSPGIGISGLGSLNSYPYVTVLQDRMVYDQNFARTSGGLTFAGSLGSSGSDGVYGDSTHNMALNWIDWMVRTGQCTGTDRAEWTRNGPNAGRACMLAHGFSSAAVDQIQQAWREWKSAPAPRPPAPPPAPGDDTAAMAACAASGGTWDSVNRTCIASGYSEDEGMGAGMWLLLILLGAAAGYGVYYIATDGK